MLERKPVQDASDLVLFSLSITLRVDAMISTASCSTMSGAILCSDISQKALHFTLPSASNISARHGSPDRWPASWLCFLKLNPACYLFYVPTNLTNFCNWFSKLHLQAMLVWCKIISSNINYSKPAQDISWSITWIAISCAQSITRNVCSICPDKEPQVNLQWCR